MPFKWLPFCWYQEVGERNNCEKCLSRFTSSSDFGFFANLSICESSNNSECKHGINSRRIIAAWYIRAVCFVRWWWFETHVCWDCVTRCTRSSLAPFVNLFHTDCLRFLYFLVSYYTNSFMDWVISVCINLMILNSKHLVKIWKNFLWTFLKRFAVCSLILRTFFFYLTLYFITFFYIMMFGFVWNIIFSGTQVPTKNSSPF